MIAHRSPTYQNVSGSLDSLVSESSRPRPRIYRAVSRVSVSSMDLTSPSCHSCQVRPSMPVARRPLLQVRGQSPLPALPPPQHPSEWREWVREVAVRDFLILTLKEEEFLASFTSSSLPAIEAQVNLGPGSD